MTNITPTCSSCGISEGKQHEGWCHNFDDTRAIHGPQPPPIKGKRKVLDLVLQDLVERAIEGEKKYGTPLMTKNGRDALVDAYQEALDLCMYLRQAIEER